MLGYGYVRWLFGWELPPPPERVPAGAHAVTTFFLLRAFAQGCTALTGVEAVSDGVPAFKPPEAKNARIVLAWLGVILITLFMGITFLARHYHLTPIPEETVVSQLARQIFGGGLLYYEIQAVTMLILILAANTSFADFPRLSYFLARDGFIPRQFGTRGDRLVFSNGILILGGTAAGLVIVFGGETHALIPLYALGVFISFTLSQASMVRRWLVRREEGWWWRWWLNAVGAATTGVVMLVIGGDQVHRRRMDRHAADPDPRPHLPDRSTATTRTSPASSRWRATRGRRRSSTPSSCSWATCTRAWPRRCAMPRRYRRPSRPSTSSSTPSGRARLEEKWGKYGLGIPLVVLTSPYRSLLAPFLDYVNHLLALGDEPHGHDRDPRVRPRPLVAAPAAQPDGAADQGRAAVPQGRRRRRRAVSPQAVTRRANAGELLVEGPEPATL